MTRAQQHSGDGRGAVTPRRVPPRRGFTIIELLVVMAIVVLLLALLLPSLSVAREAGRMAVCASNMSQVRRALVTNRSESQYNMLPPAAGWIGWVADRKAGLAMGCPSHRFLDDLGDMYIGQRSDNAKGNEVFTYLQKVIDGGSAPDSQFWLYADGQTHGTPSYSGG